MAYREPDRNTSFPSHGPLRPMDTARQDPPTNGHQREWRQTDEDRQYDDYPRHPETAEWLRRTQGGRESEREREVYMLERERELREREKQRDAWYRHAQTQSAADGRSGREREEWERQRALQEDEYRGAGGNRTEDGEYQRVLADVSWPFVSC